MTYRLILTVALVATLAGCAHRAVDPDARAEILRELEERKPDAPDEAATWWAQRRGGVFPYEHYRRASLHALRMPTHSTHHVRAPGTKALAATTWTPIGPGNIGGRTRVLETHPARPNVVYAGGAAGGLWRSDDSGATWTPIGDLLPYLSVSVLEIDPADPDHMILGTGEGTFNADALRGDGIFESTDGGATWQQLSGTARFEFQYVNALATSPNDPGTLYAATRSGLFRTTDGGASWTTEIDATSVLGCFDVVAVGAGSNDSVVASCGQFSGSSPLSGIYHSAAANAPTPTWTLKVGIPGTGAPTELGQIGRTLLASAPSDPDTVYAAIVCSSSGPDTCGPGNRWNATLRAILRSTDGGATWSARHVNTFVPSLASNAVMSYPGVCGDFAISGLAWYASALEVDPLDPDKVYAGSIEIFRSDDGGATWGGLMYWDSYRPGFVHADHHAIAFHGGYDGTSERRVYVGNDGGVYVSADAPVAQRKLTQAQFCGTPQVGASWTPLNQGYEVTQFYHGAVYPDGSAFIGGTQDTGYLHGTLADGVDGWFGNLGGGDAAFVAVDAQDPRVNYFATSRINVFRSEDAGRTVTYLFDFARNDGGVVDYPTEDPGFFYNPIALDPSDGNRLWLPATRIWRTSNARTGNPPDWVRAATAEAVFPFTAIAVSPGNPDLVLAGTGGGEIHRTTVGTTATAATVWTVTQPTFYTVTSIAFDPNENTDPDTAIAYATFGSIGGVWKSTDGGRTFANISGTGASALPQVMANTVAVSPLDGGHLWVGTEIGVFFSPDGGATWMRENTGFANANTVALAIALTPAGDYELFAFTHGRSAFKATIGSAPALFRDDFENP